jgi:hypothetical protein
MRCAQLLLGILAMLGVGGCLHDGSEESEPGGRDTTSRVSVVERSEPLGAAYVAGDRAHGLGRGGVRLAAPVNSTWIATLSPVAVVDPTGRFMAYTSSRGQLPVFRLHDLGTGEEEILARGGLSAAWRSDGALAYFKGVGGSVDLGARERPRGHVMVRADPAAAPVRWTRVSGQYVVAAWARGRLIAYRIGRREQPPDLLAIERPGRVRVLAKSSALVALSPDGARAAVSTYGAKPPVVRVLELRTGRELARLRLDRRRAQATIEWLAESGSWTGDLLMAKASPGVAVFRVASGGIELEQVLEFDRARFPLGVFEPQAQPGGRRVVGWAQLEPAPRQPLPDTAVVSCDRETGKCEQGPPISAGLGLRLVYDPSRPRASAGP